MDDLYRELIMDHYRSPRHAGLLAPHDISYEDENPLCGDRIHLTLRVDAEGIITAVGWEGDGCAISQAAASLLYEDLVGRPLDYAKNLTAEEVLERVGVALSPVRVKCALLSLKVLKAGAYGLDQNGT
ncbi:MAG: iron-sulfur cluster assembly scaffold protein [Chloroflexi bacterium]|nr:iron-sulfur cluster assembly scaffold protein [Chloroflexota bacterium]